MSPVIIEKIQAKAQKFKINVPLAIYCVKTLALASLKPRSNEPWILSAKIVEGFIGEQLEKFKVDQNEDTSTSLLVKLTAMQAINDVLKQNPERFISQFFQEEFTPEIKEYLTWLDKQAHLLFDPRLNN